MGLTEEIQSLETKVRPVLSGQYIEDLAAESERVLNGVLLQGKS